MGDEDQRAAMAQQGLFQRQDRGQVEMVGGFVEKEQVRLGDQGGGDGDPLALSTGKGADHAFSGQPQAVAQGLCLIVDLPGIVVVGKGMGMGIVRIGILQVPPGRMSGFDGGEQVVLSGQLRLLRQVGAPHTGCHPQRPRI